MPELSQVLKHPKPTARGFPYPNQHQSPVANQRVALTICAAERWLVWRADQKVIFEQKQQVGTQNRYQNGIQTEKYLLTKRGKTEKGNQFKRLELI